jgi:proteasome assembly chaperone (PAC2) family protein
MEGLTVHERPQHEVRYLVAAFAGWPDAAQVSTSAIKYLARLTGAKNFADIDPEPYFVLTEVRPHTSVDEAGRRIMTWPENAFSYSDPARRKPHMLLFAGTEPNLKWRSYVEILLSEAKRLGVEAVVTLGALMDAVPHSRETRITGIATDAGYLKRFGELGILESGYEGPAGIHTALMDACEQRDIPYLSLWAHTPHYVTTSPNPKATHGLLSALRDVLDPTMLMDDELNDLTEAGVVWQREVERAISVDEEVVQYVKMLERRYDSESPPDRPGGQMPGSDVMVAELEEFLRAQRSQGE